MSKVLVAYFSASGVTVDLSRRLADAIGADLYEIIPEHLYSSADLNWKDKQSRSSVEMNDRSSRPVIRNKEEKMKQYSSVFVGFPIWLYRARGLEVTHLQMSLRPGNRNGFRRGI